MYLTIVSLEETFVHSGYNVLPSGFILGGMARRQERHLMGDGDGNFSCLGVTDFVMGTSIQEEGEEEESAGEKKPRANSRNGTAAKGKGKAKPASRKSKK